METSPCERRGFGVGCHWSHPRGCCGTGCRPCPQLPSPRCRSRGPGCGPWLQGPVTLGRPSRPGLAPPVPYGRALCQPGTTTAPSPVPLCEMSLPHATPQSRIPRPYLDIKEIDLIVSPLKQAFNSILWGLKTLLNN